MKVVLMTREYPPNVYGGAGVHVEFLARELARLAEVDLRCFGEQRLDERSLRVRGYPFGGTMFEGVGGGPLDALRALHTGLQFNAAPLVADVVHCHTWYAEFGGLLARLAWGLPLVVTVHSLEPLRPWKREQLGRGYDVSSWIERTALELADAVIAVSSADREEVLRRFDVSAERVSVVPNGVDAETYRPVEAPQRLRALGVDPSRPFVLFLGRISRQKGITHFLDAAERLPTDVQIVLCASGPDTPELGREVAAAVGELGRRRDGVVHLDRHVSREDAVALHAHAAVFCCPSVYEPFGIINLEAMACETPVVASAVGGIRDVVVDGETGLLVDVDPAPGGSGEPADPDAFAGALAEAIRTLLADPGRRAAMGRAGRRRVLERFGWDVVAHRVLDVYRDAIDRRRTEES